MHVDPFTEDPFTDDPMAAPSPSGSESLSQMTAALSSMLDAPPPNLPETDIRVDVIALQKSSGFVFLKPREWSALAAETRMEAIKEKRVVFLCDEAPVAVRAALTWLKQHPNGTA